MYVIEESMYRDRMLCVYVCVEGGGVKGDSGGGRAGTTMERISRF